MVEKVLIRNNELKKAFALITNQDGLGKGEIPQDINKEIVPVIILNPFAKYCDIVASNSAVNATAGTLYTTPTDRDFYLTSASISMIKDVTSTSTSSYIKVTIGGSSKSILPITTLTLTPQTSQLAISFPDPIKIDRGQSIQILNGTNVANISSTATITGFTYQGDVFGARE